MHGINKKISLVLFSKSLTISIFFMNVSNDKNDDVKILSKYCQNLQLLSP